MLNFPAKGKCVHHGVGGNIPHLYKENEREKEERGKGNEREKERETE